MLLEDDLVNSSPTARSFKTNVSSAAAAAADVFWRKLQKHQASPVSGEAVDSFLFTGVYGYGARKEDT